MWCTLPKTSHLQQSVKSLYQRSNDYDCQLLVKDVCCCTFDCLLVNANTHQYSSHMLPITEQVLTRQSCDWYYKHTQTVSDMQSTKLLILTYTVDLYNRLLGTKWTEKNSHKWLLYPLGYLRNLYYTEAKRTPHKLTEMHET